MGGRDVYKISGRAYCGEHHDMRRSVSLSLGGRQQGHFRVRLCGVHVVEVV